MDLEKNDNAPAYWINRSKWLTQAFIISVTLNVGLLATFIYFVLREENRPFMVELKPIPKERPVKTEGLQEILKTYSSFGFTELLSRLAHTEHVEAGYSKRDLALACLVAFHHFNLERALGGLNLQMRKVAFSQNEERVEITMFPALAEYQFQAIIQYGKTEKWPLTPKGLFLELKKSTLDPSLIEAFSLTPPFHFLSLLFAKTGLTLQKEQVIHLLAESQWERVEEMTEALRQTSDFSLARRRLFLIQLLAERSQLAAALLLSSDYAFVCRQFDDAQIIAFLNLLGSKTPPLFTKQLLVSPRSDAVWKKAASILYTQSGEPLVEPYDHRVAVARFIQGKALPVAATPTAITPKTTIEEHVVQEGENLWKIGRLYRVSPDSILETNHLEHDRLRPGQKLKIPLR